MIGLLPLPMTVLLIGRASVSMRPIPLDFPSVVLLARFGGPFFLADAQAAMFLWCRLAPGACTPRADPTCASL